MINLLDARVALLILSLVSSAAFAHSPKFPPDWKITSSFGPRNVNSVVSGRFHEGLDFSSLAGDGDVGVLIPSMSSGIVQSIVTQSSSGVFVIIRSTESSQYGGYPIFSYLHLFDDFDNSSSTVRYSKRGDNIRKNRDINGISYNAVSLQKIRNKQEICWAIVFEALAPLRNSKVLTTPGCHGAEVMVQSHKITARATVTALEFLGPIGTSGSMVGRAHLHLGLKYSNELPARGVSSFRNPFLELAYDGGSLQSQLNKDKFTEAELRGAPPPLGLWLVTEVDAAFATDKVSVFVNDKIADSWDFGGVTGKERNFGKAFPDILLSEADSCKNFPYNRPYLGDKAICALDLTNERVRLNYFVPLKLQDFIGKNKLKLAMAGVKGENLESELIFNIDPIPGSWIGYATIDTCDGTPVSPHRPRCNWLSHNWNVGTGAEIQFANLSQPLNMRIDQQYGCFGVEIQPPSKVGDKFSYTVTRQNASNGTTDAVFTVTQVAPARMEGTFTANAQIPTQTATSVTFTTQVISGVWFANKSSSLFPKCIPPVEGGSEMFCSIFSEQCLHYMYRGAQPRPGEWTQQ